MTLRGLLADEGVVGTWDSVPERSSVRFTNRTLWGLMKVKGEFTEVTAGGYKTRRFDNILKELELAFELHRVAGSRLGGVHFELTGDDVTECIGGARGLDESGLQRAYKTQVDPRLNYEQALEMALSIVRSEKNR